MELRLKFGVVWGPLGVNISSCRWSWNGVGEMKTESSASSVLGKAKELEGS